MSFTGGGLKLKGGLPAGAGVKKKKKQKKNADVDEHAVASVAVGAGANKPETSAAQTGASVAPSTAKTEAQRKHDEYLAKRQKELVQKMASKSHRDRVQEYNQKLATLTEHHDIPKVGPG